MQICEKKKCTACYACFNICSSNAIFFVKGSFGALYPQIDERKCVKCNSCIRVCPNNRDRNFFLPQECFAAYSLDVEKRKFSASGGVGNAFAELIVKKKGYYYGATYIDNFEVIFEESADLEMLDKFKGSKYVHSHVKDSFSQIKRRLDEGNWVLFVALPCQIAGLLSFLNRSYEKLITVDLICHGVCPADYLQSEITYIAQKLNSKVTSCMFRNNAGSNFCFTLLNSDKAIVYKKKAYYNPYFRGFLTAASLRDNCYDCDYAKKERISDITIGDFIGLGKDAVFHGDAQNVSVVLVNSDKGKAFYNECLKENQDILSIERDYGEALKYGPSLNAPFKRHRLYEDLMNNYRKYGFAIGARKTFYFEILIDRLKRLGYMIVHFYKIYKLPKKLIHRVKR